MWKIVKGHSRCPWDSYWVKLRTLPGSSGSCPSGHSRLVRGNSANVQKEVRNSTTWYLTIDHQDYPKRGRESNQFSSPVSTQMQFFQNILFPRSASVCPPTSTHKPVALCTFIILWHRLIFLIHFPTHHNATPLKAGIYLSQGLNP